MPRYDFRCPHGHVTEAIFSMSDVPASIRCGGEHTAISVMSADTIPVEGIGDAIWGRDGYECLATADRVFHAPGAVHFKGPGFYSTDVKGRVERKRRRNAGDGLPAGDADTHRIAKHI